MNKQTAGMLGLKINVKLNGSNMALYSGSLKFIEEKPVSIHRHRQYWSSKRRFIKTYFYVHRQLSSAPMYRIPDRVSINNYSVYIFLVSS